MRQKIPRGPKPPQLQVSEKQEVILQRILRRATSPQNLVLRARIVLTGTEYGRRDTQIGHELHCSAQTVSTWRHRWADAWDKLLAIETTDDEPELETAIITLLSDRPRSGSPAKFTAEEIIQIIQVACEAPSLSGRLITEWTPRELAEEVVKREIVESISPSQVGRFLKRGGVETASEPLLAEQ
jgi:putative transposase